MTNNVDQVGIKFQGYKTSTKSKYTYAIQLNFSNFNKINRFYLNLNFPILVHFIKLCY